MNIITLAYKSFESRTRLLFQIVLFHLFRLLPLQQKVVATTCKGIKYGDNPQFILEELHKLYPQAKIVWLKKPDFDYSLPDWCEPTEYERSVKTIYHLVTAKVWIDTHRLLYPIFKRKHQVFIETYHGGLGIKKIEADVDEYMKEPWLVRELKLTSKYADVFISQSDHLTKIYHSAFKYNGPIWKVGYPKNDIFFKENSAVVSKVKEYYHLHDEKICLYVPTFRDYFHESIETSMYEIDFKRLKETLHERFGGSWVIMVRWHPFFAKQLSESNFDMSEVIDATFYEDIQELLVTCDVAISDYSSCLFDAALRNIPCFTFATDFNTIRKIRDFYYEMEELPFPYAKDNDSLMENIRKYDQSDYLNKWEQFKKRTGLYETGHAAHDIAEKVIDILEGKRVEWK